MPKGTWLSTKLEKAYQKHSVKKEQQFYQNMLRGNDSRGTDIIFNQNTLAWLVVIVTVFLQLISLATTYEGSKVYFGGVNLPFKLSAPLLFALAIQLIVFCMSHTIRKYFKIWFVMILVMATACSTYFSYIGIYNHINSPVDYLEERYKQIYGNMSQKYQLVKDQSENEMKGYIFDLVGEINKSYSSLSKQVEENKVLEEKISGIKVSGGKINAQTSAIKKPNINNYGDNIDKYYEDMAKYNAAVGNMITDTTKQDADLKNELYENEVKAILGGQSKEEFVNKSIEAETNKEQIQKLVASMYKLVAPEGTETAFDKQMDAIQDYALGFMMRGEGDRSIFSTLLTNLYTGVSGLDAEESTKFKENLNHFLALRDTDEVIMQPLEVVQKRVTPDGIIREEDAMTLYTQMQSEIKNAAYLLNQTGNLKEQINLTDSEYVMHNLYVLPIKNLLEPGSSKAMAWFCIAFAVLIDGLTLLFALMQGREKTPLFAKKNRDIVGRSKEAIEELLIATIMAGDTQCKEDERLGHTLLAIESFLKHFEIIPEGIESGYSMWCPLGKLDKYNAFVAVLCQFNLASILSGQEMYLTGEGNYDTDEKYLLIKTKFIIWANQKMSDLALRLEYIKNLHEIDQNYSVEGDVS